MPPQKTINDLAKEFPELFTKLKEDSPYHLIWKSAWHEPDKLFGEKDGYPVLHIKVPETRAKQVFIRSEYVQAYKDALQLYDDAVQETLTGNHMPIRRFKTPADQTQELEHFSEASARLHSVDRGHPIDDIQSALIITGYPGNGKTISLWYFLVRRLALHETVVYQDQPGYFFIFYDRGVTVVSVKIRSSISDVLPLSAWCLVDVNPNMVNSEPFLFGVKRFLVQAASPDAIVGGRTGFRYIMKPMSLGELVLASRCHLPRPDPEYIKKFHTQYGPSIRGALFPSLPEWSSRLEQALEHLRKTPCLLNDIIKDLAQLTDRNPAVSEKIFLLTPGKERHEGHVKVITDHVLDKLVDWALKKWRSYPRVFYSALASGPPEAINIAGHYLESFVHPMLTAGQVYSLAQLFQQSKNSKTWSVRNNKPPLQLIFPARRTTYQIQTALRPAAHNGNRHIRHRQYDPGSTFFLEEFVYYRPISKRQVTFNSFIYSRTSNTILAFQIAVSNTHPVSPLGLEWLKTLRAASSDNPPIIVLVGVSLNDELGLACRDGAEQYVTRFYHLKLEGFPTTHPESESDAEEST